MKFIYLYYIFARFLDYYSTIQLSYTSEENPIVRYIWERGGDIGLFVFDLMVLLLIIFIIEFTIERFDRKRSIVYILGSTLFIISSFIFLVALANLGYVWAYNITEIIL